SFALPPLGRALSVSPAALFRGLDSTQTRTPAAWWKLSALAGAFTIALTLAVVPEPWFAALFILATALLLVLLEGLVRLLRAQARRFAAHRLFAGRFAFRLALANLYRPGSPLRLSLLSLGSSLTLLVASTLVVTALLRTLNDTVPEQAPTLVFHDVPAPQLEEFRGVMKASPSLERLEVAPLVLGRLAAVNGEVLKDSADPRRALEARDEHKLSYRANDFDQLVVERGAWWPENYRGPTLVAMEDREADQLGLKVGDRLRFDIMGTAVEAELAAIYAQRRFRSQFWFEAIFTDGTLEPHITRYVGTAYMDPAEAVAAQARVAAAMPAVVTVRTEGILREARRLLARASTGLAVIAGISLVASLLVLASVIAASRAQQVYDASMLHALGARLGLIRRSLRMEYALLALVTSAFATVFGSALAFALLEYRLQLGGEIAWWLGAATAIAVSGLSLGAGAQYLLRQLHLSPALLLREAA
ncbi:MAG: ABC transporter permease, partial [Burkholderiales bacterium]